MFSFFIILIIFIQNDFLSLINPENLFVSGKFNIYDISLFFVLILCFFYYKKIKKNNKIFIYSKLVFLIITMAVISSLMTFFYYKQPVILGLRTQREILLLFLYFPLLYYINYKKKNYMKVINLILIMGFLQVFLYDLQFFTLYKISFLYLDIGQRLDQVRFHVNDSFLLICLFIIIDHILTKKVNIFNVSFLFLLTIFYIFVIKGRMVLLGLLISIIILLCINTNKRKLKILYFMGFISILLLGFAHDYIFNMMNGYYELTRNEVLNNTGNYNIRLNEISFFIELFKRSPLFGVGVFNNLFYDSYYISGLVYGYYFSDVGIFGYMANYGIFGLVIFVYFIIISFRYGLNTKNNYATLGYLIFVITTCLTLFVFSYDILNLVIFLALNNYRFINKQLYNREPCDQ